MSKQHEKQNKVVAQKPDHFVGRLSFIVVLFCLAFAGLGYRAFELQVKRSKEFQAMVKASQYTTIRLRSIRGEIFDRYMSSLAISVEVDSISCNPREIPNKDKPRFVRELSRILKVSRRKLLLKLSQDSYFVWLKRQVTTRQVRAIKALNLGKGIRILQESKRFYPNGKLASHLIGYTDRDGRGLGGVE